MLNELARSLIAAGLAGSAACVLVLLLRQPWRRMFGASSLPWLWASVPAAMLAVVLPVGTGTRHAEAQLLPVVAAPAELLALAAPAAEAVISGGLWSTLLLALWLGGSLFCAVGLCVRQWRFLRRLGGLHPIGGRLWRASGTEAGPAVIGVLRPRIVLPMDFELRFDAEQRALILEHELSHLRHGDVQVSALAAALRALYWFNPLFHVAASRLRQDQELVADAAVIARYPHARRRYAGTLLDSQLAVPGLPVGCLWQSSQALKERIQMMKHDPGNKQRQRVGRAIALLLLGGSCALAWAAQPAAQRDATAESATAVDVSYRAIRPPSYPAEAIEARQEGQVVLRVQVGEDGLVRDMAVESATAPGVFDEAAMKAVSTWRFNPAMREGKAAPSWVLVPVCFSLDELQPNCEAVNPRSLDGIWVKQPAG